MHNCLIIDDEPASRDILETYIKDTPSLHLIHSCSNALEANEVLNKVQPYNFCSWISTCLNLMAWSFISRW